MLFNPANYTTITAIGLLTFFALKSEAGTQGEIDSHAYQPLVALTMGPDFIQKGRAQTLSLLPPFENHYTNTHPSATVLDIGAFLGVERAISHRLWAQLGISGYFDTTFSPQGEVWAFASPEFNTLAYSYHVEHRRLMAEGKFLTDFNAFQAFHPYISWGLGGAFNQADHYQENALVAGAVPAQPFASHLQTSFTWGIGAGVDYLFNPHVRIGAGYQFADLGSVSLGSVPGSTTTQTLSYPHLYTNQLRFQLQFLA